MSNYSVLKQDINNNIYENQTQQITGTVLNAILNEMTASLGAGYQFAGVATVGMNPGDPDQRVFYLAGEGVYTKFGGIQVPAGKLGVLKWDNRWTLQTIDGLGGGANLTGYVSVASTDDLPDEGVATLGYLCGENLYLYVGEGGDTKEGKYQNCGSFRGPQGDSVQDVEQTQTSLENGGVNKIKFTLSNGISCEFQVRNGTTSSGLFPTLAALQAAYPSPVVGQYAFVGSGFPADIYVCTTAGTWTDSGEDYDGDNVDLTDYATKAEVNQLEAKVTNKDVYDSFIIERNARKIENSGDIIFRSTGGYPVRIYAVEEGMPLSFDIYSFSSSYVVYAFYSAPDFKSANMIETGMGTGWGQRIVKNINAPAGAKYLVFLLREGYTSANKFTIGIGNKDYSKLYLERANELEGQYTKFIDDNIVKPSIKYSGYRLYNTGNIGLYNDADITVVYDIAGARYLYIKNLVGYQTGTAVFAFYSSRVINSDNLLEMHSQAQTDDDIDGIYQIPANAKTVAIYYTTTVPFVCSDIHIQKAGEDMDEITAENYLFTLSSKFISTNGALSTSINTNLQVYRVEPGQYIYIKTNTIPLAGFALVSIFGSLPIAQDNFVSVLTDMPTGINPSRVEGEFLLKIPDGAKLLAVTANADNTSVVKLLGQNNKYSIFSLNPQSVYQPLLMNGKYRHGNEYFYTGEYDNLTLLFFSDIHARVDESKRLKAFYDVCKGLYKGNNFKTLIDDVLCGGDIVGSYLNMPADSMDSDGSLIWWKDCGLSKVLPTIGNHDAWALENNVRVDVDEETCYRTFIAPYVSGLNIVQPTGAGTNEYYPCYYYKDYVEPTYGSATPTWNTTIRLIVLDCMHWTTEQKNWLVAVLADCKTNNKSVIICSHYSPRLNYNYESTFCNLTPFADTFLNAEVPALVDESDVDFICYLSGHTHDDQFGTVVDYPNQSAIVIDCASCRQNEHTNRWENTKSQDCFNIVSFDTKQGLVKIVRIGSDVDSYLRSKKVMTYNYRTGEIVCNY